MSDLSATNCGCGCDRNERSGGCGIFNGNNSCLWIILLLLFCGGDNNGRSGCGCSDNSCIWIIILLFCCGGLGSGCGCGNNDCY